jgi:hypothetical protein
MANWWTDMFLAKLFSVALVAVGICGAIGCAVSGQWIGGLAFLLFAVAVAVVWRLIVKWWEPLID